MDGNLALYKNLIGVATTLVWSTGLTDQACAGQCVISFQNDGNLVLYRAGSAYWSSKTALGQVKTAATKLVVSASLPNLSIVDSVNNVLFSSDVIAH